MNLQTLIAITRKLSTVEWRSTEYLLHALNLKVRTLRRYISEIKMAFEPFEIIESSIDGYRLVDRNEIFELVKNKEDYENLAAIFSTPLGGVFHTKKPYPEFLLKKINELVEVKSSAPDNILHKLFTAMKENRYVNMQYKSSNEIKNHTFMPLKMYLDNLQIYINGYDIGYGFLISMAINKILSIDLNDDIMPFEEVRQYRNYLNQAWGKMLRHEKKLITEVQFEVDDAILIYFEKNPLHPSQKIQIEDDRYIVTLMIHSPM